MPVWYSPRYLERYGDPTVRPAMSTGSATTLPMTDDEKAAAAKRERTKVVGFTAKEDQGCPYCGAPPGDFCHTPDGKPRNDHKARTYA